MEIWWHCAEIRCFSCLTENFSLFLCCVLSQVTMHFQSKNWSVPWHFERTSFYRKTFYCIMLAFKRNKFRIRILSPLIVISQSQNKYNSFSNHDYAVLGGDMFASNIENPCHRNFTRDYLYDFFTSKSLFLNCLVTNQAKMNLHLQSVKL